MRALMKNLQTLFHIAQAYFTAKKFPISVTFIATYRCNFSCRYCGIYNFDGYEMNTSEVISMIDEFSRMGMRRFSFNGGEPLLRPDIQELTAYCKKKGLFTTLFTNGWQVRQKLDAVRNLDILIVTLDGPPETHDLQRNKPESCVYALEAIRAARRQNIVTWTNTVITRGNAGNLDFILQKAKEMGFWAIFQPVLEYAHSSGQSQIERLKPDTKDYQAAVRLLISRKKEGAHIAHSYKYLKYILNPDWGQNKRRCWAARLYCAVKPNGEVAPCYPVFNQQQCPNGLDAGFAAAFQKSELNGCGGCYCIIAESDFFYSLYPGAVINTLSRLPGL